MNTDFVRETRRRIELLEREGRGKLLRDWRGWPEGGGAAPIDDDRRSCLEAIALNFSGRKIPPGHVGWVETDANEVDLGQVYPVANQDLYFVGHEFANFTHPQSGGSTNFTIPSTVQPDDLLVAIGDSAFFLGSGFAVLRDADDNNITSNTTSPIRGVQATRRSSLSGSTLTIGYTAGDTFCGWFAVRGLPTGSIVARIAKYTIQNAGSPDAGSSLVVSYPAAEFYTAITIATSRSATLGGAVTVEGGFNQIGDSFPTPTESREGQPLNISYSVSVQAAQPGGTHTTAFEVPGGNVTNYLDPQDAVAPTGDLSIVTILLKSEEIESAVADYTPTCNPLILREVPREAGFTADAKSKSAARKTLASARLRRPVVAKVAIDNNGSGVVVWGGVTQAWVYRRNFTDRYAGIAPENATRTEVYGAAIGSEIGRLGRYYKKLKQGGDDPRLGYFFGRPDLLYSQSSCGPVEIVQWGRDGSASSAIEVTLTATRTSASGSGVVGTWDAYELSTGASVLPDQTWTAPIPDASLLLTLDAFSSGNQGRALWIDLGQDGGASPPLYGDSVANVLSGESSGGAFGWLLFYNRTLLVYPKLTPWQAVADAGEVTDTIVFAGSGADATYSGYAPWIFADPVTDPASFAAITPTPTFADWPEVWPEAPGQVPEGSNLTADAAYDPYFGRALGKDSEGVVLSPSDERYETDQRLGLQLAAIRFLDHCPGGGSAGGCC
jgi:hypothetical protein